MNTFVALFAQIQWKLVHPILPTDNEHANNYFIVTATQGTISEDVLIIDTHYPYILKSQIVTRVDQACTYLLTPPSQTRVSESPNADHNLVIPY
jgi:hypothetical protein